MNAKLIILYSFFFVAFSYRTVHGQPPPPNTTVSSPTKWVNNPSQIGSTTFPDGTTMRPILSIWRQDADKLTQLHCGFASNGTSNSFLFAVFVYGFVGVNLMVPQLVWSANRHKPIGENGTLELTFDGDLVLKDADGTNIWSSNTSSKSDQFLSMLILDTGNLVLSNNKTIVWQSFDHPTDSLLLGQQLVAGQVLGSTNWTNSGLLSMAFGQHGLGAFVHSDPPQMYFYFGDYSFDTLRLVNGTLELFLMSSRGFGKMYDLPYASSVQFLRLDSDGHLRLYEWNRYEWKMMDDFFSIYLTDCEYPTVCGNYGICSNGQCSCPTTVGGNVTYFEPINDRQVNLGCEEVNTLSCEDSQFHQLLDLRNASYFSYIDSNAAAMNGTDVETCKTACLRNCSCKAAFFRYDNNVTDGICYLPTQVFSIKNLQMHSNYQSSAFVKVQTGYSTYTTKKRARTKAKFWAISIGSSLVAVLLACLIGIWYVVKMKIFVDHQEEEEYFDDVMEMPTKFSFEELKSMTDDFQIKLGEGGFGGVFEGKLPDGTKVAVKKLDSTSQGMKEFIAEVKCVGSIHHFNLVRLIGFCAEKSHKLLVYEYMSNGSLDKWIFHGSERRTVLSWQEKGKIILDIANGLHYLHHDCRKKIAHLDVKPQNVLLDDKFNAKLSDFGMSKQIDKEKSHVITSVRGTLGYLAPEWLGSKITEKVDVYSFGIVVLEIVCGRKVLDYSLPEDETHLPSLLKRKAEEGSLVGMVDDQGGESEVYIEEALKMVEIGVWCLQADCTKRPSMSTVIKVLEGRREVEVGLDWSFLDMKGVMASEVLKLNVSAPPQASVLSGPR